MRRIGTAQFQRRRRAIGLGIAGIGGQFRRDLVGAADDRIEAVERLVAVERGADLVLQRDPRVIEPAAPGDRERIGDVERVERVNPAVLVGGAQRDRADRHRIAGLSEKDSAAADDVVRADRAEFGARREPGHAGIEAGSDHEVIVVPEQLIGVGRLQGEARRRRTGRRPIDLAQDGAGMRTDWRVESRSGRWPGCCRCRNKAAVGSAAQGWVPVGLPSMVFWSKTRTWAAPSIVQVGVASTFPVRLT